MNKEDMKFWADLRIFCKKNDILWLEELEKASRPIHVDEFTNEIIYPELYEKPLVYM
jgi:hypothetical protein